MSRYRWSSLVLILSLVLATLPHSAWANTNPTISLVPSSTTVGVGDMVYVDIVVDDISDLYAIEVHLSFDVARLQVLDDGPTEPGIQILPGSLFPKSDPSYVVANSADNAAGTIDFAITLLAPEPPLDVGGTLATIRLAARMEGSAALSWTSSLMADSDGNKIEHTTTGTQIEISPAGTTPAPGKNCSDVIENGGFEADSHWRMPVTPHRANYTTADKHSGLRSMRLGIEPGDPDVFSFSPAYYKVNVPANATSVTLTFWAKRRSQEAIKPNVDPATDLYDPGEVIEGTFDYGKGQRAWYDRQELLILQGGCYNWLATLMRGLSNDGVWTQYTYDITTFVGQDILIYFNVINNGNGLRTWMFVDDVVLDVCYDESPCTELVSNRSFEWTGDWERPYGPRQANYTTDAQHTGSRSMRLGIVPPTADTYSHSPVYQAVVIPEGAPDPTLSFWYKAHSQESPRGNWKDYDWSSYDPSKVIEGQAKGKCCGEVDWQEMLILDTDYRVLSGGVVMRQVQNDGQWKQITYDLSPYKGMTIVLYFNAINDGNGLRTWMYVDDVSVNLCGSQIHFDPPSTQVGLGATFTMALRAENVADLYEFDATVRFDPAILEVVSAGLGDWMPSSTHVTTNTADNAAGTLRFAANLVTPTPALSGSGNLVSIAFHAKAAGTSAVYLQAIKLVDADGAIIPVEKSDGQVTVTTGQATLSGKAFLDGRTDHSGIEVEIAGGHTVVTVGDGSYTYVTAPGTYTLTFSYTGHLRHCQVVTGYAGQTTTVPDVTLPAGDVNADGRIDILDLSAVGSNFGSTNPSPSTADVNADGKVDILDIVLVAKNFNKTAC